MPRILIAGGSGALGREIVAALRPTGHPIRILSRKAAPTTIDQRVEWVQADVATGSGIAQGVRDVDVIVNCVSDPFGKAYQTDVTGTRQFLQAARQAGVQHVLHISIVGIDQIPSTYYQIKREAEQVVCASGIPWTNIRIVQFHTLLDLVMQRMTAHLLPFVPLPLDWKFQLIDTSDVAAYLVPHILGTPAGRLPDLGGPEVLPMRQIARQWLDAKGDHRPLLPFQLLGRLAFKEASAGFVRENNLVPDSHYGRVTWSEYVRQRYAVGRNTASRGGTLLKENR
ncbi:MAG: SDR family oxidoreductase [Anaerolineae bacterium]|nr:SDR family oxidoreductase [Anaerolineae bacterium]